MEIRSQEGEIPIPLNTSYGGVHPHHHGLIIHHDHPSATASAATGPLIATGGGGADVAEAPVTPFKKMIKYGECLKNHAAAMGANATDGCGEFMPSGEDGTLEALSCSACGCHRNFHRKEIEGEPPNSSCDNCFHPRISGGSGRRKLFLGSGHHKPYLTPPPPEAIGYHHLIPPRAAVAPHQMIMSYNMGPPSESDDQEDGGGGGGGSFRQPQTTKKRFRTKFTQEQKEKMLEFAEKVGWKIQKQEEGVVQQFCQEIGVKRRVLKVWMHNNKHNLLAKKNNLNDNNNTSGARDLLDPSISMN